MSAGLLHRARSALGTRAGAAFLAGDNRGDALQLAHRLDRAGLQVTLAYWDGPDDAPQEIETELAATIAALTQFRGAARVSLKAPPIDFDTALVERLCQAAAAAGVGIDFDAHAPGDADRTLLLAARAAGAGASTRVAIPARWQRSLRDAPKILEQGLGVRIVKGQWSDDPASAERLDSAFMQLAHRLAAYADRVNLATHDARLLERILRSAPEGARPFAELELLLGMPSGRILRVAARHGVPVRWYLPYGVPSTGFHVGELLRRPRLAGALAQGIALGPRNRALRERELRRAGLLPGRS